MRVRAVGLAVVTVGLATLACGGSVGGSGGGVAAAPMILDLRFTQWDCYEGGAYEWIGFKTDGRCDAGSDGWTCAYTQTGNDFSIVWAGPSGESETWTGLMVNPSGMEMGGTSLDHLGTNNDFRCTRDM